MMYLIGRPGIDIERNKHLLKTFFDLRMIFINYLLRCNAFLHGTDGDRDAMFITTTHKKDIFFSGPFETYIYIRRDITAREMTDMNGAICIWKCCSNQDAIVFFHNLSADLAPQGMQKYVIQA